MLFPEDADIEQPSFTDALPAFPTEPDATAPAKAQAEDVPEMDPQYRQDFDGLLYIGALRKEFSWLGHTFAIRTVTVDELLRIGLAVKQYEGTIGANRAYVAAVVAASIERVDGKPLHQPLGPGEDSLEERFRYVRQYWYTWTIDRVYQECAELEARVAQIIESLGKSSS